MTESAVFDPSCMENEKQGTFSGQEIISPNHEYEIAIYHSNFPFCLSEKVETAIHTSVALECLPQGVKQLLGVL